MPDVSQRLIVQAESVRCFELFGTRTNGLSEETQADNDQYTEGFHVKGFLQHTSI